MTKHWCNGPRGPLTLRPAVLGEGYVNDRVFVPPLPRDLAALKARIIAVVKNTDAPMLTRVWQELKYRIDMCRVTCGAQI